MFYDEDEDYYTGDPAGEPLQGPQNPAAPGSGSTMTQQPEGGGHKMARMLGAAALGASQGSRPGGIQKAASAFGQSVAAKRRRQAMQEQIDQGPKLPTSSASDYFNGSF